MATNINSLLKSEKELWNNFIDLLNFALKTHCRLEEYFKTKKVTQEMINKFVKYKDSSLAYRISIRDDCLWIISKDQPRSTHLRFIIATLYSVKDVERIIEYAYNMIIMVDKINFSNAYLDEIISILTESNKTFSSLISLFKTNKTEEKNDLAYIEINKFKEKFSKFVKNIIFKLKPNIDSEIDEFFNFSILVKYIERTIDHIGLIFENYAMIKSL